VAVRRRLAIMRLANSLTDEGYAGSWIRTSEKAKTAKFIYRTSSNRPSQKFSYFLTQKF
jgi:hypothetical protein